MERGTQEKAELEGDGAVGGQGSVMWEGLDLPLLALKVKERDPER